MADKIGPTGEHPDGKIRDDDEGELKIAVTEKDGNVIMNFGTLLSWFGMPPELARHLGMMLVNKANEIDSINKNESGGPILGIVKDERGE